MTSNKSTGKRSVLIAALCTAFVAGLLIPSPLFHSYARFGNEGAYLVRDTVEMIMPDGSVYEGTINAYTEQFDGYGALKRRGASYVGKWKNGELVFGKMSTDQMTYEGRFNIQLECHGFGIAHYLPKYVDSLSAAGIPEHKIITAYIGNFKNDIPNGLGRARLADSTLEFGRFLNGMLVPEPDAEFHTGDMVYGIDLSHFQPELDWDQLALFCDSLGAVYHERPATEAFLQPVFFACIKATEGVSNIDPTFHRRMIQAKRHGIVRGAYHFMRLHLPVTKQIDHFTAVAYWLPGDLPPTLDIELESEILELGIERFRDSTYRWLKGVEEKLGVKPMIYTTDRIRDLYLNPDARFHGYRYWMARYSQDQPMNADWTFWQFSSKGMLNGCDSLVDLDRYHSNIASFRRFLQEIVP